MFEEGLVASAGIPHRLEADEAYQVEEPGHPVRTYLEVEETVRAAAATSSR